MLHFLLLPFAWLYHLGTAVRNHLYDSGFKTTFSFDRYVLSVGNLRAGGTGKTPMVEYLINLLSDEYNVATLSRGYGRKTRGFRIAGENETADTIGDEPLQFHTKFPEIPVTVCEERAVGIPFILAEFPDTDIILLDDAFQHRPVKPDLNILLTAYDQPFFSDHLLPAGRLRESRKGAGRADLIVVTRCPRDLSDPEKDRFRAKISRYAPGKDVFFARVEYLIPAGSETDPNKNVVVFSGIANPHPFVKHVHEHFTVVKEFHFRDHHNFTEAEIAKLANTARRYNASLMTTEKDMARLGADMRRKLEEAAPLHYIPIRIAIDNGQDFDSKILQAVLSHVSAI